MPENAETLLARIDTRLGEMDRSRYWLSKEASDGKSTKVVLDIERKGTIPKEPRLRAMAALLGVSVDWLMGRTENRAPVRSEVELLGDRRGDFHGLEPLPRIPVVGTGDCADIELASEGNGLVAIQQSSFDPDYHVDYVSRPAALAGDREAYAIEFRGDSMEPRFAAGERALVSPSRHAGPGDDVVVQLNDGESGDVVSVLVKRLVTQNAREIVLRQYNPPVDFHVPRARVSRIHRIVEIVLR